MKCNILEIGNNNNNQKYRTKVNEVADVLDFINRKNHFHSTTVFFVILCAALSLSVMIVLLLLYFSIYVHHSSNQSQSMNNLSVELKWWSIVDDCQSLFIIWGNGCSDVLKCIDHRFSVLSFHFNVQDWSRTWKMSAKKLQMKTHFHACQIETAIPPTHWNVNHFFRFLFSFQENQ